MKAQKAQIKIENDDLKQKMQDMEERLAELT